MHNLNISRRERETVPTLSLTSSQAKGTRSTLFLTNIRNKEYSVPLACEDDNLQAFSYSKTSMARTPLKPCKHVQDRVYSS